MRKHDVRKWLHAILDLLPIFVIPAFMIFTQRHDVQTDTVIVTSTPVYYESNDVESVDDLVIGNIYTVDSLNNASTNYGAIKIGFYEVIQYSTMNTQSYTPQYAQPYLYGTVGHTVRIVNDSINTQYNNGIVDFVYMGNAESESNIISSIEKCNRQYIKEYIDVETTVPNNVGTSLMNNFINTCNEYFNFDNVFTFGDIHNWVNINIFGGNPPAVVGAIWNIIVYEFLMDMLFLFYSLFMFLIDFIESCMERAFCKANHGGVR